MSIVPIVNKEAGALSSTAHLAVVFGMRKAWERCEALKNTPHEPDFVASLVLESAPLIYRAYRQIFQSYEVEFSLTSVYCHQTPKITYPGIQQKTSCELGDLLFVHIHRERDGRTKRNALLYQAKVIAKQPHRIPSNEQHQLKLYTDWPEFEYYHSPPLTGQERIITPQCPHRGAQYLLIDDGKPNEARSGLLGFPGTYPAGSCVADAVLEDHNDLANEIVDSLAYRTGRAFGERPGSNSSPAGWTQTIWDLLDVSLKKVIRRKNSGLSTEPRVSAGPVELFDGMCFALRTSNRASRTIFEILGASDTDWLFSKNDGPPDDHENRMTAEEGAPGMSLVLIETSEAEE